MQYYIRELLREEGIQGDSSDDNDELRNNDADEIAPKRGRPRIPEKWTRVISVYGDPLDNLRTFELGPELLLDQSFPTTTHIRGRPPDWKPIYWPPHIKKQQMEFKVDQNLCSENQLIQYG